MDSPRFIVDINVGKLARWLRMLGFDATLFGHGEDFRLIKQALAEGRVLVTKDSRLMQRRVITTGRLRSVLVNGDRPEEQMRQVITRLGLEGPFRPFTRCLEDNHLLLERRPDEVADLVPAYVRQTQTRFRQCPACKRVYWPGTHWQAMLEKLREFTSPPPPEQTPDHA